MRESDHARAFLHVVEQAETERPDVFLHAGDLFDGVRPGNRALATAMEAFVRLDRAGIPTVVIAGNHDHPRMRSTGSPFRLFSHLRHVHVVYKGQREQVDIETRDGTLRVQAVPQCADQGELAEQVASIPAAPDGVAQALVAHGSVPSIEAFAHAEFNGQDLDASWFDDRFDYVALGHFHGVRQVAPRAWYCGASERVSIAEAGEEKVFLDVTLHRSADPREATAPAGIHVEQRPIPVRPYIDLPSLDARGLDAAGLLLQARRILGRVPEGAVARLRIQSADPSLRGALDVKAIREVAPHALHLDLRVAWADAPLQAPGSLEVRGLAHEWGAFLDQRPVEGLDKARLRRLGLEVLHHSEETSP